MAQAKGKVGSLFFGMTLDTNDFKKNLKEVKKQLADAGKEMRQSFSTIATAGVALGAGLAAAGTGMLFFAKNTAEATNEQLLLADSIGATQSEIAGLELGAQKFGVEQGMLIDKMREFGGIDAFKEIAEQVKGAGDASEQMAKSQELLGNEGLKLLPILQQGAEGFAQMEKEAFDLGLALSPDQIEKSRVAWDAYEDTLVSLQGIGKQIGTALLEPFGVASAGLGSFIKTFKDDIINGFSFIADVITGFIQGAFELFAEFGIPMINSMLEFAAALGDTFSDIFDIIAGDGASTFSFIGDFFKGFLEFMATFKQNFIATVTGMVNTVIRGAFNGIAKFSNFLGDLLIDVTALAEAMGLVEEGFTDAVAESFGEQAAQIRGLGRELAKPFKQAQETATDEAAKILERLADKNEKDQNTFLSGIAAFNMRFGKTVSDAGETVKKAAIELAEVKDEQRAGVIVAGSQEEAKILNAQGDKNLQIQQKQLKEAIKQTKALQGIGVV
ncbi:MAG: hypothetical protein V3U78_09980 [Thiotrichaceae bacterium]